MTSAPTTLKRRNKRTTWFWSLAILSAIALAAVIYRDQLGKIVVAPRRDATDITIAACERVIDGDSLVVTRDGQPREIRLEGIDCPEFDQPFRDEAKSFTAALCENKQLRLQSVGHDRYGREIVRAFADSKEVNAELVKAGLAWQYGSDGRLNWLEKKARAQKVGIWSQPNPVPPWEWRSANQ